MDSRTIAVKRFLRLPFRRKLQVVGLRVLKLIIWILWDFTGLRWIYRKIRPDINDKVRRPSTFLILFFSGYVTLFQYAEDRYYKRVVSLNAQIKSVEDRIFSDDSDARRHSIEQVPVIQRFNLPQKPYHAYPITVFQSILLEGESENSIDYVKDLVGKNKDLLYDLNLAGIDLSFADLEQANFSNSGMYNSNLKMSNLWRANLKGIQIYGLPYTENLDDKLGLLRRLDVHSVYELLRSRVEEEIKDPYNAMGDTFYCADFSHAILIEADLSDAAISEVNFEHAVLGNAKLNNSDLTGANLHGAFLVGANLMNAKLSNAIWTNGEKCQEGSIGKCIFKDGTSATE